MSEAKSKKCGSKKLAGGSAPCGHSHCDSQCHVRYVGAVSHPMHHHVMQAARGASHIWSAAVIVGLAMVVTGSFAYTVVDAKTTQRDALTRGEYQKMMERVKMMEKSLKDMTEICAGRTPADEAKAAKTPKTETKSEKTMQSVK